MILPSEVIQQDKYKNGQFSFYTDYGLFHS